MWFAVSIPDEDDGPDVGGGAPASTSPGCEVLDTSVVDVVSTGSETARVPSPSSATVVVVVATVVVVAATALRANSPSMR